MPMSSIRMSRALWKPSQSPGKSPEPKFGRQANVLARLRFLESASEFPDVVRGHAWACGAGADRHATPVCLAGQFDHGEGRVVGRAGDHDADTGLLCRGAGGDAL